MPSNVHLEVDPELRKWLVGEARRRMVSVNAWVKVVLWERREEEERKRRDKKNGKRGDET